MRKNRKIGKKKVMVMGFVILALIVAGVLYLFTPFGLGRVSLDGEYQVKITVNGEEMTATMENNTSAQAFRKLIENKPKTVRMRDYGSMEKVGMLWKGLPSNNQNMTTQPGDIILYMGSSLVVYYEPNSWNFTKMGHINDVSKESLQEILGNGRVTMTFELID